MPKSIYDNMDNSETKVITGEFFTEGPTNFIQFYINESLGEAWVNPKAINEVIFKARNT